jgi:hypothetical protein
MINRNIEDIDNLFREGLNPTEDHLNFQEDDWLKLKERLDRNEKRKRRVFWLSRLGVVAALILLFFTIRMLLPEDRKLIIQQAEVQHIDENLKEEQNQPVASKEVKKAVSKTESGSKALLAQNNHLEEKSHQKKIAMTSSEMKIPDNDTVRIENLNIPKESTAKKVNTEVYKLSQQDMVKPTEQKQTTAEESLFAPNERPNGLPEPEHQYRKLTLSVLAAPDYNGVNNLNNASLGNDFGLLVTLKIAKNWSFSTGGIYAKKLYETGFTNYSPTKNIWDEYYPKSVNADCRVLDIPLNISYNFFNRKNTSISLGSGISSYIMLREDYRFRYAEQDINNPLAYHVVNENRHWLGVLNFQATFEQRLNSRVSVGLQPYLKIPLSNIGFAGVKLQSLGMAAILNWNFN